MDRKKQLLKNELARLLSSNGNLDAAVRDFYARYPDPKFRKDLAFFILDELIAQAKEKAEAVLADEEVDEYKGQAMILLGILQRIMKGGKDEESKLFLFCETVRKIPGAKENDNMLRSWVKELILGGVGLTIQAGRRMEDSENPPY